MDKFEGRIVFMDVIDPGGDYESRGLYLADEDAVEEYREEHSWKEIQGIYAPGHYRMKCGWTYDGKVDESWERLEDVIEECKAVIELQDQERNKQMNDGLVKIAE